MKFIVESQYFAPISVYSGLVQEGTVILIEHCENYQKRSFRNKCLIATANGVQSLIVPLESGKNAQQSMRDVKIANVERWQLRHWQAIRSAYGKSPYFEHYAAVLDPFFAKKYTFLFDMNMEILNNTLKWLKCENKIDFTTEFNADYSNDRGILDMRNRFRKEKDLEGNRRYPQVFEDRFGFTDGLSVLDLLFCMGPSARQYL